MESYCSQGRKDQNECSQAPGDCFAAGCARLIGVVVNDVRLTRSRYSYYYNSYYYHSYYGSTDKPHNGKRKNSIQTVHVDEMQEEKR